MKSLANLTPSSPSTGHYGTVALGNDFTHQNDKAQMCPGWGQLELVVGGATVRSLLKGATTLLCRKLRAEGTGRGAIWKGPEMVGRLRSKGAQGKEGLLASLSYPGGNRAARRPSRQRLCPIVPFQMKENPFNCTNLLPVLFCGPWILIKWSWMPPPPIPLLKDSVVLLFQANNTIICKMPFKILARAGTDAGGKRETEVLFSCIMVVKLWKGYCSGFSCVHLKYGRVNHHQFITILWDYPTGSYSSSAGKI